MAHRRLQYPSIGKRKRLASNVEWRAFLLLFQSERTLNTADFLRKSLVDLQALLDSIATVDDSRMIAVTNQLADTSSRHLSIFLCQIHRNLAHLHIVAPTTLAEDMLLGNVIVLAYLLKDIVDGKRMRSARCMSILEL